LSAQPSGSSRPPLSRAIEAIAVVNLDCQAIVITAQQHLDEIVRPQAAMDDRVRNQLRQDELGVGCNVSGQIPEPVSDGLELAGWASSRRYVGSIRNTG
jgi:hypothetical protein